MYLTNANEEEQESVRDQFMFGSYKDERKFNRDDSLFEDDYVATIQRSDESWNSVVLYWKANLQTS